MLAITGATGAVGGRVARALADDFRNDLRLVVRDPSRAPDYDTDVRVCEYADHAAAVEALRGVDTLFMVSAAEAVDRRDQHRTFIRAAADAGVGHIVYTSFAGAAPDATFTLGRDHWDAEQAIRESGMAFTFLRDNFYADLLPYFADEQGVIRGPAGDGRVAAVARADVADVAAAVLRSPSGHAGRDVRADRPGGADAAPRWPPGPVRSSAASCASRTRPSRRPTRRARRRTAPRTGSSTRGSRPTPRSRTGRAPR